MIHTSYRDGEWDFPALYAAGQWEPETRKILERFLDPGSLFLDVGAWVGPVTLWAVELGAAVAALEPDPQARDALILNVEDKPVTVLPFALASSMGLGMLTNDRYLGNSESRLRLIPPKSDVGTEFPRSKVEIVVEQRTPKFIFDWCVRKFDQHPDLVKVDIEGNEVDVLPKLAPLCAKYKVPLLVSWHQDWWPRPYPREEREPWFEGLECEGEWDGWAQMLAVPE